MDFSIRCMFLTLRSPATRDFRLLGFLAFVLLLATLVIEEDCLAEASNQIKETSHKNLNKNAARIPRVH